MKLSPSEIVRIVTGIVGLAVIAIPVLANADFTWFGWGCPDVREKSAAAIISNLRNSPESERERIKEDLYYGHCVSGSGWIGSLFGDPRRSATTDQWSFNIREGGTSITVYVALASQDASGLRAGDAVSVFGRIYDISIKKGDLVSLKSGRYIFYPRPRYERLRPARHRALSEIAGADPQSRRGRRRGHELGHALITSENGYRSMG